MTDPIYSTSPLIANEMLMIGRAYTVYYLALYNTIVTSNNPVKESFLKTLWKKENTISL